MKFYFILFALLTCYILSYVSHTSCEIYEWTDMDGKKHCTNIDPNSSIYPNDHEIPAEEAPYDVSTRSNPSQGLRSQTTNDIREIYNQDIDQLSRLISELQKKLQKIQESPKNGKSSSTPGIDIPSTIEFELTKQIERSR